MTTVKVYPPASVQATVTIDGVPKTITVSPTAVPDGAMRTDVDAAQADATQALADAAAVSSALGAHEADTAGAHAASAIAVTPAGGLAATDVQAALVELDGEVTAAQVAADAAQADVDTLAGTVGAITLASLGGDAAGTPRPPTAHTHGAGDVTQPDEVARSLVDTDIVWVSDSIGTRFVTLLTRLWSYVLTKFTALSEFGSPLDSDFDSLPVYDLSATAWKRTTLTRIAAYVQNKIAIGWGTWTPTVTAVANLDSTPTIDDGFYIRVGTIAVYAARAAFDATAGGATPTEFRLTLPVPSNLASVSDAIGIVSGATISAGRALGNTATDELRVVFNANATSSDSAYVFGMQRVL